MVGRRTTVILFISVLAGTMPVSAENVSALLPIIPSAKGEHCVEPTDVMRRQHMDFIMHQRDLTVHDGIRTKKYQFVRCINCHVQPNEEGVYPRHVSSEHFCTSCHEFASVSIDCFQCHADRPTEAVSIQLPPEQSRQEDFLQRLERLSSEERHE